MKKSFLALIPLIMIAVFFTGCASLRERLQSPSPVTHDSISEHEIDGDSEGGITEDIEGEVGKSDMATLLDFLAKAQSLPEQEREQLFRDVRDRISEQPDSLDPLRLALLRLTPGMSFTDLAEGHRLLKDYLKETEVGDEIRLLALVRLLDSLSGEYERLASRLANEKQKSGTLARKLNELKNIENILKSREVEILPGM